MLRTLALFLIAICTFGADDPWSKVKDLKTGTDLRVWKKGVSTPLQATMDELTPEHLRIVVKKEQVAIPVDQIDRVDARPSKSGPKITKETRVTNDAPDTEKTSPNRPHNIPSASGSSSSNVTFGGKADFETVYRRLPAKP
jgi:hypothetical protein